MAKPKQKPEDSLHRSPGRSRFNIPRKETPQIDGSYLDRLFADLQQQSAEQAKQSSSAVAPEHELPLAEREGEIKFLPDTTQADSVLNETAAPPAQLRTASLSRTDANILRSADAVALEKKVAQQLPRLPANVDSTAQTSSTIARGDIQRVSSSVIPDDEERLQKAVRTSRLTPGEVSVLRVIIELCRERGSDTCYIKIPQLMSDIRLSDRQTQRVLRNLHSLDLIEKLADYSNIDRLGTLYRLKLQ